MKTLTIKIPKVEELNDEDEKEKDVDAEFMNGKLKDYYQIDPFELNKTDHFRYTQNKYKEQGRRCSYGICHGITTDGKIETNSYGEQKFKNWFLDPENNFKKLLFYVKHEPEYTGFCISCSSAVNEPYTRCFKCLRKKN